jgi:hypothetical protein
MFSFDGINVRFTGGDPSLVRGTVRVKSVATQLSVATQPTQRRPPKRLRDGQFAQFPASRRNLIMRSPLLALPPVNVRGELADVCSARR